MSEPKIPTAVTMRDVARAAGVSRMTVSRALRKDGPVSAETRERILQVVRDLNYVPDQMAGSLATKRSGFVAVLVPSLNNLHFAETVQSLSEDLAEADLQILLGYTNYSQRREEELVEAMLRRRPEAIVLSYDGHSARTVDLLSTANVPVIELWERPETPIEHTIGFSNEQAAHQMTEALLGLGYRNLTFLCEAGDDWTRGAARRAGFQRAMGDHGLAPDRVVQVGRPPLSIEDGAGAVDRVLTLYPDTECIFCVSDAAAFGVLSELKTRSIQVPDDIGVAGFGDFEVSRFASPTISTVLVNSKQIGHEAGCLIRTLLQDTSENTEENSSQAPQSIKVDIAPKVALRDSTRQQTAPPSESNS